jgi:catechol 2,3-dioxygenase-like lactoylglutathione lyase family enzyme
MSPKLISIAPKLPSRNCENTKLFYVGLLGFKLIGDYGDYVLVGLDGIEIHFFQYPDLNPFENYGQIYLRVSQIDELYLQFIRNGVQIHPNGSLANKPWNQREFSLLDPDYNLLTFGEGLMN